MILVGAVLALAGCGDGGPANGIATLDEDGAAVTGSTAAAVDPETAMLDFAECMRAHGIDLPDPEIGAEGGGLRFRVEGGGNGGEGPDPAQMEEAFAECSVRLEGVAQDFERPDETEIQDRMFEYAECMRENGYDLPDPDFSDGGGPRVQSGGDPGDDGPTLVIGPFGEMDPGDPAFQAAQEACGYLLGGGPVVGSIEGGVPGGGGGFVGPGGD